MRCPFNKVSRPFKLAFAAGGEAPAGPGSGVGAALLPLPPAPPQRPLPREITRPRAPGSPAGRHRPRPSLQAPALSSHPRGGRGCLGGGGECCHWKR